MSGPPDWLGQQTLRGAIMATIVGGQTEGYAFLERLARGEAVPEGCDARFVAIAGYLVTGKAPDPTCHAGFERTWSYFRQLCLEVCANVGGDTPPRVILFERLERAATIAGWTRSLAEIWELPRYAQIPQRSTSKPHRYVSPAEALFVWRTDPQGKEFLTTGRPPSQTPLSHQQGGSYAHQTMVACLIDGVYTRMLTLGYDPVQFLVDVAAWMGDADGWPNWNMHSSFGWMAEAYHLGREGDFLPEAQARKIALAWPEIARTLGRNLRPHDSCWSKRASESWLEGLLLGIAQRAPQIESSAVEAYRTATDPVVRRALWSRWACSFRRVRASPDNPFDNSTRNIHPFIAEGAADSEPPQVTVADAMHYLRSCS